MPKKTFPIKLYQMLQYIETENTEQYNSIIAWQDHGRCFRIHDKKRLEEELLPLFFGTAKYQSFRRSLNNWNFRMILGLDNPDRGCYYHHQFLRSQSVLCARIKRVVSSSCDSDDFFGGDMPFEEPLFHTMQPLPSFSSSIKSSSSIENHYDPITSSSNTEVSKEEKRGNVICFESDLWKRRYEQEIPLESQVLSFLFSFMPYSTVSKEVPILPVVPTITTNLHILTSTPTTVKEDELLPRLNLDDANDDMHIGIDPHAFEDLPEDPRELCHVFD